MGGLEVKVGGVESRQSFFCSFALTVLVTINPWPRFSAWIITVVSKSGTRGDSEESGVGTGGFAKSTILLYLLLASTF